MWHRQRIPGYATCKLSLPATWHRHRSNLSLPATWHRHRSNNPVTCRDRQITATHIANWLKNLNHTNHITSRNVTKRARPRHTAFPTPRSTACQNFNIRESRVRVRTYRTTHHPNIIRNQRFSAKRKYRVTLRNQTPAKRPRHDATMTPCSRACQICTIANIA